MPRHTSKLNWTAAACLVLAAALVYSNSFNGIFQFDDRPSILEDQRLANFPTFAAHARSMIRPLTRLTFLIDRGLYGDRPAGYHLLNLLLHCGSGLLVFAIVAAAVRRVRSLSRDIPSPDASGGLDAVPFAAALLFVVHPLGTETVTYMSGRATGMAAFFFLLSVYLFVVATAPETNRRKRLLSHAAALLCFVLALLSKETAAALPLVLLLWQAVLGGDQFGEEAGRPGRAAAFGRSSRVLAPYWLLLVLLVGVASLIPRYAALARASLETRSLFENLLTQANAVAYALTLFVLPSRLNFDHDLPVHGSLFEWPAPLAVAILAAITVAAWWIARRAPLVAFGLAWFLACVLPTNSVVPRYDILSERNLYLPSIGLFMAAAATAAHAVAFLSPVRSRLARPAAAALLMLVAAVFAFETVRRNEIYGSEVAFWSDAARKSPLKARPHNNLGHAYLQAGEVELALVEFRRALALDSDNVTAQRNLRKAWLQRQ
jgi:protein O-mannosyl-transferase